MRVNDHYHRPKKETLQKVMEVFGEDPKECFSQTELDKRSELESVRETLLLMGHDPQKLGLQLCDQDPPDCQANDVNGNLVGWEVTGLYDKKVEKHNSGAKTIKDMKYRDWNEEALVAEITRTIEVKDKKIAKMRAENTNWPFASLNLVIPTDELTITRAMADSMQGRFSTLEANNLNEVYLLLSYDPSIEKRPLVRIR
jgi:hypothetical protein